MKRVFVAILLFIGLLLCFGCTHKSDKRQTDHAFGYTVVDDAGRTIELPSKPRRIVSLTYGTDEILLELVGTKRIKGFSQWAGDGAISFVPKEAVYKVGCRISPCFEGIYGLEPDLVVASTSTDVQLLAALEDVGIKTYISSSPKSYKQMCDKIIGIAKAVGEVEKGRHMVMEMNRRMDRLEHGLSKIPEHKQKVVIAFSFTTAIGRKGELFDNMLELAHIKNGVGLMPGGYNGGPVSKEQVIAVNPDMFFLPTWNYNGKENVDGYAHQIMDDPAYRDVKAVKNKQVRFVDDKYRYVASQHIVEAIEKIAKEAYQEELRGWNNAF